LFDPQKVSLHGGKDRNDVVLGQNDVSIKSTATDAKFTWFSKKDRTASANVWLDFSGNVYRNEPLHITVFYDLSKYLPESHDGKITAKGLERYYSESSDMVRLPPVDLEKIFQQTI
jgi:hypothetical protein